MCWVNIVNELFRHLLGWWLTCPLHPVCRGLCQSAFLCVTLKNPRGVICKMTAFWWKEKGKVEYIKQKESRPIIVAFQGCWDSCPKELRACQPVVSLLAMVQAGSTHWCCSCGCLPLMVWGRFWAQSTVGALVVQWHSPGGAVTYGCCHCEHLSAAHLSWIGLKMGRQHCVDWALTLGCSSG